MVDKKVVVTVGSLIKSLQDCGSDTVVLLASDEEQNTLFSDVRAVHYTDSNEVVLFGCSGSEVEG